jgi:hypothetical protein
MGNKQYGVAQWSALSSIFIPVFASRPSSEVLKRVQTHFGQDESPTLQSVQSSKVTSNYCTMELETGEYYLDPCCYPGYIFFFINFTSDG